MSGEETRQKILSVAETLFAEKGYDGTGVDQIAKTAGVNKALIYYHFKDKKGLMTALFQKIIDELKVYLAQVAVKPKNAKQSAKAKVKQEIDFLDRYKKIIAVLFMEGLKAGDEDHLFFKGAEHVMSQELMATEGKDISKLRNRERFLVHEFFTGFIPVISFIALRDAWCDYFDFDQETVLKYFIEAFEKTHLQDHIKPR